MHDSTASRKDTITTSQIVAHTRTMEKIDDIDEFIIREAQALAGVSDHDLTEEQIAERNEYRERSKLWRVFEGLSPQKALEDFQETMQSQDDDERKANGLEPRPWSEISAEIEEVSARMRKLAEHDERTSKNELQKALGLEPFFDEEPEAGLDLAPGHRFDQVQEMVTKYDDQKRKKKGLEPRSWREFREEYQEVYEEAFELIRKLRLGGPEQKLKFRRPK
ncbi:MAG: hypothetical protein Q9169_000432 [Polycauliona sp. 2 TL-2023]